MLLAMLVVADLVLSVYVPHQDQRWYELSVSGCKERFHRKIFEYICSNENPQVVILGSSLAGVPSMSTDLVYSRGKPAFPYLPPTYLFSQYKKADYFKKLLRQSTGAKISVVNLGVAGAVVSDHPAILEKAAQFNKHPSLVICTIAPVEFMWSNSNDFQKTRIRQAFQSYSWPLGSNQLAFGADWVRREAVWHADCLKKELSSFRVMGADRISELLHGKKARPVSDAPFAVALNPVDSKDPHAGKPGKSLADSATLNHRHPAGTGPGPDSKTGAASTLPPAGMVPGNTTIASNTSGSAGSTSVPNNSSGSAGSTTPSNISGSAGGTTPSNIGNSTESTAPSNTSGSAGSTAPTNISGSAGSIAPVSAATQIMLKNLQAGCDRWGRKNGLPDLAMYKRNYSNFNEPVFKQHVENFEKMLEHCQKNGIPLVVVNMPLTKQNRDLIAKPVYDKYYSTVTNLTLTHNTPFIDMDKDGSFLVSEFFDSTHLNDDGGKKFFELLTARLSQHNLQQVAATGHTY